MPILLDYFVAQSLGIHSVALMVHIARLSDNRWTCPSMLYFPDSVDVIASLLTDPGVSLSISKDNA